MSYLVQRIIPDSEYTRSPIDESDYVQTKYRRRRKFKMPYNLSLRRLKLSSSTTTLIDFYSDSWSASPRKSFHEPHDDVYSLKARLIPPFLSNYFVEMFSLQLFDQKNSRRRSSSSSSETFAGPSPFPQFMDDACRQFLEEKLLGLQNKKALTRQPQYIYGEPGAAPVPADALKEPCLDYRLYDMSEEEEAALVVRKRIWEEDKTRGVHFASFLKVKRRELAALLQKVYGSGTDMQEGSTKPHAATAEVRTKCKNCTQSKPVVPPGLDPAGFLPLVYHNRAKSCKRQRSDPEEAEKARTIVAHRMIQKSVPGLSTWTDRRTKTSRLRRSPLHKSITAAGLLWNADGCAAEDGEPTDADLTDLETDCSSDSVGAYSGDATNVTHDSTRTASTAGEMQAHQLQSARTYRVPDFLPAGKESRPVVTVKGKSLKEENKKPKTRPSRLKWKLSVDKPLPPLPPQSPPPSPHPNERDYPRSLRRSQSEIAILRGRHRAL
ncbi:uncharacterized protein FOMMEDRAFT_151581 [Fomitiporia mediterranea MF3/22]|uniref:uncharacterized protein n=1 Tax=Fomitiporia mediterranea (strain MF3/22) TaxID=694068 RepID=UPI000440783B|nr:uncharacterized protein FOMMEDRAFT_151581 [Fomitiporia mediterranea MF3/22]EJD06341.1 hypothetical protein FOMMEDRAFT_151581 [Fomitiporia mediterranea MF3/22]